MHDPHGCAPSEGANDNEPLGAAIGLGSAPTASAYSSVHEFGTDERLYDAGGAVVTAWTVRDLEPSRDTVPDYPLAGKLWQATATVQAAEALTNVAGSGVRNPPPARAWPPTIL